MRHLLEEKKLLGWGINSPQNLLLKICLKLEKRRRV